MNTQQLIDDALASMNSACLACATSEMHGPFGSIALTMHRDGRQHWTMNGRSTSRDRIDSLAKGTAQWPQ